MQSSTMHVHIKQASATKPEMPGKVRSLAFTYEIGRWKREVTVKKGVLPQGYLDRVERCVEENDTL